MSKRGDQIELAKVDVDANQSLAASFCIQGILAVKAFHDRPGGRRVHGRDPAGPDRGLLDGLVPSPADELVAAGDE